MPPPISSDRGPRHGPPRASPACAGDPRPSQRLSARRSRVAMAPNVALPTLQDFVRSPPWTVRRATVSALLRAVSPSRVGNCSGRRRAARPGNDLAYHSRRTRRGSRDHRRTNTPRRAPAPPTSAGRLLPRSRRRLRGVLSSARWTGSDNPERSQYRVSLPNAEPRDSEYRALSAPFAALLHAHARGYR